MATATEAIQTTTAKPKRDGPSLLRVALYVVLIVGAVASLLPFVSMMLTSLKSYGSLINGTFWPWPPFGAEPLQWQNYPEAIRRVGWDNQWQMWLFFRYFANSLIMAVGVTAGVLITSVCAAYALAQMNLPGKNVLFVLILATIMVPPDLTLVPKVVMMYQLGWYNTYLALIVPFMASVFGIFLLRQFFMQIPRELYEAAVIDGAGHLRYLISVVVPLSKSALITLALLQFVWEWDSFKWPLLVTRDTNMRVLAVGLQQYNVGEGGVQTHLLMAFATVVIAPVIVFYFFTQKYFREGIVTTGIKG
jgi:ABC-type glycerol-3-phosphate transport system permease component